MKKPTIQQVWVTRCKILNGLKSIKRKTDAINVNLVLLSKEFQKPYLAASGDRSNAAGLFTTSIGLSFDAEMFRHISRRNILESMALDIRSKADKVWGRAVKRVSVRGFMEGRNRK